MTDIGNWWKLIRRETAYGDQWHPDDNTRRRDYPVIPLNEYQMGNLLGLLKRSRDKNNGDWFYEFVDIAIVTMETLNIKELVSNWGDKFTVEDLKSGEWLKVTEAEMTTYEKQSSDVNKMLFSQSS